MKNPNIMQQAFRKFNFDRYVVEVDNDDQEDNKMNTT